MKSFLSLLALSVSCLASPEELGASAIQFLSKVSDQTINLEPNSDTAISPQTSVEKKTEIAKRLKRMANDISLSPLSIGQIKIDGDLAAIMIWQAEGFDPREVQAFPMAMVKKEGKWLPAPILGSFDNAGVGYDAKTRQRIATLEKWMLEQRVFDLEKLRSQALERIKENIAKEFDPKALSKLSAMEVGKQFLDACKNKSIYKLLGFLGGLSETLPDEWPMRAKGIQQSMTASHPPIPWSFLSSPHALRAIVNFEEDKKNALISLACLDPSYESSPKGELNIQIIHLNLKKTAAGLWQIVLPDVFFYQASAYENAGDLSLDSDLFDAFPEKLQTQHPATPLDSADKAREAITNAFQQGRLQDLVKLIHLPESPKHARSSLMAASKLWWSIRGAHSKNAPPSMSMLVPLDMKLSDNDAVLSYQWFSPHRPDRFQLKLLYLQRTKDGWLWNADPDSITIDKSNDWMQQQELKWENEWQSEVLKNCPVLAIFNDTQPPSEADSKQLIESWLKAVESGNLAGALELCAMLNLKDSQTNLLRNLGYDVVGAQKREIPDEIGQTLQNKSWTGVGVKSSLGDQPAFTLYPVVNTTAGPKILIEVDLLATGGRGREFLNRTSIDRLSNFDIKRAKSLQELFEKYEQQVITPNK